MPFTPTHIVGILPFWPVRRWFPFSAFAIGSMVPDIGLFFWGVVPYALTHSFIGVICVCLPIGVSIQLLFEAVMRRPLIALLPVWFQQRIEPNLRIPESPHPLIQVGFFCRLAVAVVVGALTHVCWDAFTHKDRWGTKLLPILNETFPIGNHSVPNFKILQYCSTLIGLPLLAAFSLFAISSAAPQNCSFDALASKWKWLAAFIIVVIPMLFAIHGITNEPALDRAIGTTIKNSGAVLVSVAVVYCVYYQVSSFRNTL